jgi:hypothetical protein
LSKEKDLHNFLPGHHHWDLGLLVGTDGVDGSLQGQVQDSLVEKDQCVHRLVLGSGCDILLHRQMSEKGLDFGFGWK